jgi:hypothetical protein
MAAYRRSWAWVLLAGAIGGCGRDAARPPETGAEEVAGRYYEALAHQDWTRAYADLEPASRTRCSPVQFARLGKQFHRGIGFEPEVVHVRSCE